MTSPLTENSQSACASRHAAHKAAFPSIRNWTRTGSVLAGLAVLAALAVGIQSDISTALRQHFVKRVWAEAVATSSDTAPWPWVRTNTDTRLAASPAITLLDRVSARQSALPALTIKKATRDVTPARFEAKADRSKDRLREKALIDEGPVVLTVYDGQTYALKLVPVEEIAGKAGKRRIGSKSAHAMPALTREEEIALVRWLLDSLSDEHQRYYLIEAVAIPPVKSGMLAVQREL